MNDLASIMVVTYNRLPLSKQTIDSLLLHTTYPFRLVLIDNGSTDGTVGWARNDLPNLLQSNAFCKSFDYYLNDSNRGIATGRNQALKIATQYKDVKYLSTIDNDVEFVSNWLNDCVDFLNENAKFIVGINYEDVNYPIVNFGKHKMQLKNPGNLGTACTVFRKELFNDVGYFTHLNTYAHEDALFGYRSRLNGYQMAYLQTPGVHLGSGTNDIGEYRQHKDYWAKENLQVFYKTCQMHASKQLSTYVSFDEEITSTITFQKP